MAFVYILRCADGAYYVGSTRASLEARVSEHNAGHFGGYTAKRRPVALVWSQEFLRIDDAIAAERQVKGWRREKKEALIRGDFGALPGLASRRRRVETSFETAATRPPQDEETSTLTPPSHDPHPEEAVQAAVSKDRRHDGERG